jgi:RNA polymerase sigma-70 factor (family 1)
LPDTVQLDLKKLLVQISDGDEKAFSVLYTHFAPRLRNYVYRMIRSDADSEEVIQEIFIRIWLSRDKLPEIEKAQAWIFTITARLCLQYFRKKSNEQKKLMNWKPGGDPQTPVQILDVHEITRVVQTALQGLPEKTGRIYRLNREQGLAPAEIAQSLAISVGTVKNQLTAANKYIRQELLNKGISIPVLIMSFSSIDFILFS